MVLTVSLLPASGTDRQKGTRVQQDPHSPSLPQHGFSWLFDCNTDDSPQPLSTSSKPPPSVPNPFLSANFNKPGPGKQEGVRERETGNWAASQKTALVMVLLVLLCKTVAIFRSDRKVIQRSQVPETVRVTVNADAFRTLRHSGLAESDKATTTEDEDLGTLRLVHLGMWCVCWPRLRATVLFMNRSQRATLKHRAELFPEQQPWPCQSCRRAALSH
ncbi:hypothetical protein WMY93_007276 [Mugilogobius chulae]|uniref:Uncharacterized protein n=1 Tax=Mugilogobius chulae TaxID=88201 RepID=A0AAW0PYG8_9GOBI